MKDSYSSNVRAKQEKNTKSVENELELVNIDLKETKGNVNISSQREIKEKFSIRKENPKIKNRKYLMIIPIVIVTIILISIIVFFLIRLKSTKKDESKEEIELEKNNEGYSFTAIYQSKLGEKIKLFNPISVNMNENEYQVYLSTGNSTLRTLEEIESNYGEINSTRNGLLKIIVNFTKALSNLDFMFEGCEDLISANLSQINSPSLQSSIYTFTNCKNLKQVDLSSIDTSKVTTMDFLFSGCNNLVEIKGLEKLNTSSVKKTAGMFLECEKLREVNLSAFKLDEIEEPSGMFINNTSLEVLDLGDCSKIDNVLEIFPQENNNSTKVTIFANIEAENRTLEIPNINFGYSVEILAHDCVIGDGKLCKECDKNERSNYCKICNEGYYLPNFGATECRKCNEGCKECYENEEDLSTKCNVCKDGYKIFNGNCIKDCEIGENEKCYDCKTEEGKNDQCLNCNEGYYFDAANSTSICKKIEIDNCKFGKIESDILICLNCSEGYYLKDSKCYEACQIGENEKCASCNQTFEFRENCQSCNPGFYLDSSINSTKCQSCSINNLSYFCRECDIISGQIKCIKCKEGFSLINDTCYRNCDDNCIDCIFDGIHNGTCRQCKEQYYLKNNYILENYQYYNEYYCAKCPNGCLNCSDYYLNSTPVGINCFSCLPGYKLINSMCEFQCSIGENNLCLTCDDNIKNRCASCNSGYYLDTTDGTCHSCEVDNCDICNKTGICDKCIYQYEILNNTCFKTCEIGENEKCRKCANTELEITKNCLICNEGYYLPDDSQNKTICYPCEFGCADCYGNINEPICRSCKEEFKLINGECIKNCKLGLGELCRTCNYGDNNQSCSSCNEGYYLPENISERKKCKICGTNMKVCHEENNEIIPDECYYPYKISGRYCMEECVRGSGFYCSSCSILPEKINQCQSCNMGYYLPSDSDKKRCYKCPDGCKNCNGTLSNNTCSECDSNYKLYQGKCIRNCYTYDKYYYCKTCNTEEGKNNRCLTCNEGYYLPYYPIDQNNNTRCQICPSHCIKCIGLSDGRVNCSECDIGYYKVNVGGVNRCYKCSTPGCLSCEGDSSSNICTKCSNDSNPFIIENKIISCYQTCDLGKEDKCKSCQRSSSQCYECNDEYTKFNGQCVLDYHFEATYKTTSKNELVYFINNAYISRMKINGTIIKNPHYYYTFENPGEHIVYIKLSSTDVFSHLFTDNRKVITIKFLEISQSAYITYMNDCFSGCINLISIDMTYLNLKNNRCFMNFFMDDYNLKEVKFPKEPFDNIYWFYRMFYGCKSLTSIDMSLVSNYNGGTFYEMFYGCTNLKSIKLNSFTKACYSCRRYNMFIGIPPNFSISIHKNFYETIKEQFGNETNITIIP